MKTLRWLLCFPVAAILSWLSAILISEHVGASYYGGDMLNRIYGLSPIILATSLPAILFVVAGVWMSPSKNRRIAFVFFTLSILFSGGWVEMDTFRQVGSLEFWLTSAAGMVAGSLIGLLVSLPLQTLRSRKPIQNHYRQLRGFAPACLTDGVQQEMSAMIEVYYKAPADAKREKVVATQVGVYGGKVTFREEDASRVTLTIEFEGRDQAEVAMRELTTDSLHVEGPCDY